MKFVSNPKTTQVCEFIAKGLTIAQACAAAGLQERHWLRYAHRVVGRARAESAVILENIGVIEEVRDDKQTKPEVRLKAAALMLERIYRRQYGQDDRQIIVHAEQTNYSIDAQEAKAIDARAARLLGAINEAETPNLPGPIETNGPERS